MQSVNQVTWYISRFDRQGSAGQLEVGSREPLPIEGRLFQGTDGIRRLLDLTIRNVSEQFEGRFSCTRHFDNQAENDVEQPIDVGCVFVISKFGRGEGKGEYEINCDLLL